MKNISTSLSTVVFLVSISMVPSQLYAASDDVKADAIVSGQVEQKSVDITQIPAQAPAEKNSAPVASGNVVNSGIDISGPVNADPMSGGYLLQLIFGLLVVLACIVILAWFAKRVNRLQSSGNGVLQIIGGLSMGSRERVVLLQVGTKQLLLGVAPGNINMLHVLDGEIASDHSASDATSGQNFSEKIRGMITNASITPIQKGNKHND